jgi:ribonuclease M5
VCNAQIITTDGFGIFKKHEKLALIRKLGSASPIILLTDSDGAGKLIRSHLTSALPKERIIQLYIPKIKGKEKRKDAPSAEGTLGVEGMEQKLLYDLLAPFENGETVSRAAENPLSKADFYRDGLSGADNSAEKRDRLAAMLDLPSGMSANALLSAIKMIISYEEYERLIDRFDEQGI